MNMRSITLGQVTLIVGVIILILGYMTYFGGGLNHLKQLEPAAQILSSIVLIMTVIVLTRQLGHIQEQNDLQRTVASKSSIQELNKVLLDEQQEDFLRFVFPGAREKDAREAMMAFSLMNSLEMLYLTRDKNADDEAFKGLLKDFIPNVRVHWKGEFPTVYHPDFRKIVQDVFNEPEQQAR